MNSHWHILGAGSIGSLFAAKLDAVGCETTLLVKGHSSTQNPGPATVTFELHSSQQSCKLTLPASYAEDTNPIQQLLVTTKAYDAVDALASVAPRLSTDSHIVLMVNGMGLLEELEQGFPQLKFYAGTTTEGAYRRSKRDIVHAGTGITKIGRRDTSAPPAWFKDFAQSQISCQWERDIHTALWQKLAVNCAINPLTALYGCPNGDLEANSGLAKKLLFICDEIAAIAFAAGQDELAAGLHAQVHKVVLDTAANRSSMLQDIEAKRRTEVEYITGYLIRTAAQLNIPAPLNQQLMTDVQILEAGGSIDTNLE